MEIRALRDVLKEVRTSLLGVKVKIISAISPDKGL